MALPILKLANGVKKYDLTDITSPNMEEAQDILDNGTYTRNIDAESAYTERRHAEGFVGTYKVDIDSNAEYNRFIELLEDENMETYKAQNPSEYEDFEKAHFLKWLGNKLPLPTEEEWKSNKIERNGKVYRLGKWLKRVGYEQQVIDFFSAQVRTGKETMYLTISDMPQHIAGMTYNAGDWHSCQHPDSIQSTALAGSLHDDTLLVAMLHSDIDDVDDMEGRLLARVVMRIMKHESVLHLLPSSYYGNDRNQARLHRVLGQLDELNIHNRNMMSSEYSENRVAVAMEANGFYDMTQYDTVWVHEDIEEEIECECPMCKGDGQYDIESDMLGWVKIECPMCEGSGNWSTWVYQEIREEVEVEEEQEIEPYQDDYSHYGNKVYMYMNCDALNAHYQKWGITREDLIIRA